MENKIPEPELKEGDEVILIKEFAEDCTFEFDRTDEKKPAKFGTLNKGDMGIVKQVKWLNKLFLSKSQKIWGNYYEIEFKKGITTKWFALEDLKVITEEDRKAEKEKRESLVEKERLKQLKEKEKEDKLKAKLEKKRSKEKKENAKQLKKSIKASKEQIKQSKDAMKLLNTSIKSEALF